MKNDKKKKRLKRLGVLLILLFALSAGMMIGMRIGGRNLPGLTVAGIPVGGLSEGETLKILTESGISERSLRVKTFCGIEGDISAVEAGVVMPIWDCVEAAHDYGRTDGIHPLEYLRALRGTEHDVNAPDTAAGDAAVRAFCEGFCSRLDALLGSGEWQIDTASAQLAMIKGGGMAKLDCEDLCTAVKQALTEGKTVLEYHTLAFPLNTPDFEGILEQVCVPPVSAKISDDGKYRIIPGKSSYSFDAIQAEEIWTDAQIGDKISIPLIELFPDVTESDLDAMLYGNTLGEGSVSYAGVSARQLTNIRKAASAINGAVILPGESLSFIETAGPFSVKNGYETAPAYTGSHAADVNGSEAGGGCSRVSTALYQAALSSELPVPERTPHRYEPDFSVNSRSAYVGALLEGGEKDLVVSNPFVTPIKVSAQLDERAKTVTVSVLGAE